MGIKIAANTGERLPEMAQLKPIELYTIDNRKLTFTILTLVWQKRINLCSSLNCVASASTSQAGKNAWISSVKAMPTSLCFKAPASLSQSPIMSTFSPFSCNSWMYASLPAGLCSNFITASFPKAGSRICLSFA